MRRPLYYLLCAIACTSMVGATMPMAAIADAIQPQATAEQQAQSADTNSDTDKPESGTDTNAAADTVEDSTPTSTGTSAANTESADSTAATTGTTATPGTTIATDTPTPSLRAQTNGTPAAISATSQTGYAHSATATQNGVTFTVSWNDAPAGTATTFHVTQANGSSQAKVRMDVPTYWDGGSQESVCDPSRQAWAGYHSLGTAGHDFTFNFTASGTYRIYFYFMDNDRNDPQNDKGIYYLRTTAETTVNDAARPSITQIVNNAVDLCRQETNGSDTPAPGQWRIDYWANVLANNGGSEKAIKEFFTSSTFRAKKPEAQARLLYNIVAGVSNPTEFQIAYWTNVINSNGLICAIENFLNSDLFTKQKLAYNIL